MKVTSKFGTSKMFYPCLGHTGIFHCLRKSMVRRLVGSKRKAVTIFTKLGCLLVCQRRVN